MDTNEAARVKIQLLEIANNILLQSVFGQDGQINAYPTVEEVVSAAKRLSNFVYLDK